MRKTGLSPLQFVTRERINRAQQMMRESKRGLIEIALEVGYAARMLSRKSPAASPPSR